MKKYTTSSTSVTSDIDLDALVSEARDAVGAGFGGFCVMAGISSLQKMMGEDAAQLAGQRHERNPNKPGYRWGTATGMVGFHGGRIAVERPRVRNKATGRELPLQSREEARDGGLLEQWATTLMLMNVSTRRVVRNICRRSSVVRCGCRRLPCQPETARDCRARRCRVGSRR